MLRCSFRTRLTLWFLLIFAVLYVGLIGAEMLVFAYTVRDGDSLSNRFITTMEWVLVVAVPLGLAAAGLAGYVLAGRVVEPLRRVTEVASHVGPDTLSERVELKTDSPEVTALQHELNEALRRIEHGYHVQQRFISNVSHELRTPIAVMMSQAQILRARADTSLADYRQFAEEIIHEMRQLGRMVESFLMLTHSDQAGRLERAVPHYIFDVILDAIEHNLQYARHYGVQLAPSLVETERDCMVRGDADLLKTMLDNLIRNAIRHTPRGQRVDVAAHCEDHTLAITVRDRGAGLTEESMVHLFDRFYRSPQGAARTQGTGIGLAIVKSVVSLHGGEVRAFNHESGGAVFEVKLPLWVDETQSCGAGEARIEEAAGPQSPQPDEAKGL